MSKITVVGNYDDFIEEINKNIDKAHNSPYHTETIKEHINKTIELSKTRKLKELAKYHDLGKSIAMTDAKITSDAKDYFLNENGAFCQYMGHQNVSGVYYLTLKKDEINTNEDIQEMLELIIRHDDIINGISDKKKKDNNITDEMIETLKEFNKIDRDSSVRSKYYDEYVKLLKRR